MNMKQTKKASDIMIKVEEPEPLDFEKLALGITQAYFLDCDSCEESEVYAIDDKEAATKYWSPCPHCGADDVTWSEVALTASADDEDDA